MTQQEIISEITESIKKNTSEIVNKHIDNRTLMANLVKRGMTVYTKGTITPQIIVDLASLALTIYLQENPSMIEIGKK